MVSLTNISGIRAFWDFKSGGKRRAYPENHDKLTYNNRETALIGTNQPEVTVCYNPQKPKDAHIKEFRSGNPNVYLIIGLISMVAAFVLIVVGAVTGMS